MTFTNELTHLRAIQEKKEGLFHSKYEKAVEEQLQELKKPQTYPNIIGGKEVKAKKTFDKFSPNDRTMLLGKFPLGSAADVNAAVKAAWEAFPEWSKWDHTARVAVFQRIVKLFREHKYELAAAVTLDNGKNRDEAVADVDEAIDFMSYYSDQVKANDGYRTKLPPAYENERSMSILRPYGVWAVVCPFNFPIAISMGMASAAMITGNTVVIKPSSLTPFAFNQGIPAAGGGWPAARRGEPDHRPGGRGRRLPGDASGRGGRGLHRLEGRGLQHHPQFRPGVSKAGDSGDGLEERGHRDRQCEHREGC